MKCLFNKGIVAVVFCMTGLLLSGQAQAQDLEVPANTQAAIFRKVFNYIKLNATPKITIVYPAGGGKVKDELKTQFKNLGLECDDSDEGSAGRISTNVVYLMQGVAASTAKKVEKKFIITTSKEFINEGLASIGLVASGGKYSLLASIYHIGNTGYEVDPQLFRIAQKVGK